MTIQECWKKIKDIRKNRTTCVTIDLWLRSDNSEYFNLRLWIDEDSKHVQVKNLEDLVKAAEMSLSKEKTVDGELPIQEEDL